MNLNEIQSLREEKPREFDALVAEKVHGWKWAKNKVARSDTPRFSLFPIKGLCLVEPYQADNKEHWSLRVKGGIKCDGQHRWVEHYHSDANADLLSHRVACGWLYSKRMKYLMELSRLWDSRYKTESKITGFQLVSKYEVGDFSQIALATVMEDSAKGEGVK